MPLPQNRAVNTRPTVPVVPADNVDGGRKYSVSRVTSVDVGTLLALRDYWSRTKTVLFLRKEVIQPHLPVRLPCYDFTPIANPTFDSSLPKGLGHWLRVLPTFVV